MSVATDRNQRILLIAMPFFFVIFVFRFPAGLLVYWITTNIWTVGQQLLVRRAAGAPTPWAARAIARDEAAAKALVKQEEKKVEAATPPPPPRRKKKRSGRRR